MRFVAVKTEEQQARGMLFHTRDLLVRQRTQTINALRGHLAEFGGVSALGHEPFAVASDEEGAELVEMEEALEVEVGTVEEVEGARFGDEHVEEIDVVEFAVGDVDKARDRAAQVE